MYKKEITFDELCNLVSEIDYINNESFPFSVSVENGKKHQEYNFGIGDFSDYGPDWSDEWQYVSTIVDDTEVIIDLQEPDIMTYNEIQTMLKKKLNIKKNTNIYLWTNNRPCNGKRWEDCHHQEKSFVFSNDVVKELKYWNTPDKEEYSEEE